MSDRAGDCEVLFQNLGVEVSQMLKCCAHIILCVDHGTDKVFRDIEQKIGVQQLLQVTAGEKIFTSPSTSIHTLGLIAIAKLLSPSHAQHSVSLYNEFKSWMANNGINCDGFKGFVANRFGRIAELAQQYLKWRESIQSFFDAVVDINSNKLVLAVSTFIQNDWFTCCSEIYSKVGELLIFPIMELFGIDKKGEEKSDDRSWAGAKRFFESKMSELKKQLDNLKSNPKTGKDKLMAFRELTRTRPR